MFYVQIDPYILALPATQFDKTVRSKMYILDLYIIYFIKKVFKYSVFERGEIKNTSLTTS